jgi:oligopeptide transport system ATP-binding protein
MSEKKPLLVVDNLLKTYPAQEGGFLASFLGGGDRIPALNGVSFSLTEGETLGLTGESGCGKSVLARIISGQEKPDKGSVLFQGRELTKMSDTDIKAIRRNLRFVAENSFSDLVDQQQNRMDKLLYDVADKFSSRGEALDLLKRMGLDEKFLERLPGQLSGGEKQRIALVRALASRPKLIVADEPVSNLDVNTRIKVLGLLRQYAQQYNIGFVFISQNLSIVRYFALKGNVGIMFAGRIMEVVPGVQLFDKATHPYSKSLLAVNPNPSPVPAAALDLQSAFAERERADENDAALDNLEATLSQEGNMALAGQLAANRPGCPYYRWCPEHFDECKTHTPQLLTVVTRRNSEEVVPLPSTEIDPQHKAACLWYNGEKS